MGKSMSFSYDMRYPMYIRCIKLQKIEIFKIIKESSQTIYIFKTLNIILLFSKSN
jgi:hypothetical protein